MNKPTTGQGEEKLSPVTKPAIVATFCPPAFNRHWARFGSVILL